MKFQQFILPIIGLAMTLPLHANLLQTDLQGQWINQSSNRASSKIPGFTISEQGSGLFIEPLDKCQHKKCDWEKVPLRLISPKDSPKQYVQALAVWKLRGSIRYLILSPQDDSLQGEIITVLEHTLTQSNYSSKELFTQKK